MIIIVFLVLAVVLMALAVQNMSVPSTITILGGGSSKTPAATGRHG